MEDREKQTRIDLSIIIVNWNTKILLHKCIKSILKNASGFNYELIIVDNASSDGSVKMIKQDFPQAKLIENTENVGFAKANNQAMKLVKRSKYILLLNSDVTIKDDAIQKMIDFLEVNSNTGGVGPVLILPNGKLQKGGVGGYFPSLFIVFNYYFFLSILFPKIFRGFFLTQRAYIKEKKEIEVDWIACTCFMTRLEIFKRVGGLDESTFMYAEDLEWSERIKKDGWKIFYLPYVEVIHNQFGSQKRVSGIGIESLAQYMRRKYGIFKSIIFRLITFLGLGIRFIGYSILFIFSGSQEYREKSRQICIFTLSTLRCLFR